MSAESRRAVARDAWDAMGDEEKLEHQRRRQMREQQEHGWSA